MQASNEWDSTFGSAKSLDGPVPSDDSEPEPKTQALKPAFTYAAQDGDKTVEYIMFDIYKAQAMGERMLVWE